MDELQEKWQGKARASSHTSKKNEAAATTVIPCPRCRVNPARFIKLEEQEKRGADVSTNSIPLPCEECVHVAAAERDAESAAELEVKRQQRATQIRANLEAIGVNVRKYFDQTPATSLETFDTKYDRMPRIKAAHFFDGFVAGKRESLYLYSERPDEEIAGGNGKTHLAVALLSELALDPRVPIGGLRFVFVPELLMQIQDTFDNPERSMTSVVNRYVKPELLVWDDFGAEKLSDFAVRTIFTILYKREGRSNVFTSNLSLDQVEARDPYAARITSRIAGDARIVKLTGPDRRLMRPA